MKIKNILLVITVSLGLLAFTFNPNCKSRVVVQKESNYTDTSKSKDRPFEEVEVMPEYPGGHDAMMKFIAKNFKYPEEAKKFEIEGRVIISFVVNEDGKITDIKALLPKESQLGYGLEEETMRVISLMPNWKPGTQSGKAVKTIFTFPYYCSLSGER